MCRSRLRSGRPKVYSSAELVDDRVLEFYFPGSDHAAGGDPAAALPQDGRQPLPDLPGGGPRRRTGRPPWTGAGLQPDSWQGALLDNQWCRIYCYRPAA